MKRTILTILFILAASCCFAQISEINYTPVSPSTSSSNNYNSYQNYGPLDYIPSTPSRSRQSTQILTVVAYSYDNYGYVRKTKLKIKKYGNGSKHEVISRFEANDYNGGQWITLPFPAAVVQCIHNGYTNQLESSYYNKADLNIYGIWYFDLND